jgi:DNA-binding transcriptional LysR family regulator
MLNLRQLNCFVAVAEASDLGQAAIRLNISASPLSRQIRALEHGLGLTLLERSRQRLWLTEAGRNFLDDVLALLAHADRVEMAWVRCPTSISRCFRTIVEACSSTLLTETVRMLGRDAASEIASAPLRSFLLRLTKGFTYCGGINFTRRPMAPSTPPQ